jgi:hypothetical protein
MKTDELDLFTARDRILAAHAENHGAMLRFLRRALVREVQRQPRTITADDAHDILDAEGVPADYGGNRRFLGALFRDGQWRKDGWVISRRPQNHGRPVQAWRLKS